MNSLFPKENLFWSTESHRISCLSDARYETPKGTPIIIRTREGSFPHFIILEFALSSIPSILPHAKCNIIDKSLFFFTKIQKLRRQLEVFHLSSNIPLLSFDNIGMFLTLHLIHRMCDK